MTSGRVGGLGEIICLKVFAEQSFLHNLFFLYLSYRQGDWAEATNIQTYKPIAEFT